MRRLPNSDLKMPKVMLNRGFEEFAIEGYNIALIRSWVGRTCDCKDEFRRQTNGDGVKHQ